MKTLTSASFEEKLQEIEEILIKLNDENTTLKDSIELFKKGSLIARDASELLENAQLEIQNFKYNLQNGFSEQNSALNDTSAQNDELFS